MNRIFVFYYGCVLFTLFFTVTATPEFSTFCHTLALHDALPISFLLLVSSAVADRRGRRITFGGLAIIAAVWTLDALLQALSGTSPLFWGLDALKQLIE